MISIVWVPLFKSFCKNIYKISKKQDNHKYTKIVKYSQKSQYQKVKLNAFLLIGGVGRYTLPPGTTKRRITNLNTKK